MRLRGDSGLTLIELILVILVLPVVIFGMATFIGGMLQADRSVSGSVSNTASMQSTMQPFLSDVQASTAITTDPVECGPLAGIISIQTPDGVSTYALSPDGRSYVLLRYYCSGAASATATSVTAVARGIVSQGVGVSVSPDVSPSSWTPSSQVYGVTLNVTTSTGTFSAESNPNATLVN
jgi:Tfp pilus assembly protein PilV